VTRRSEDVLHGANAVIEALRAGRRRIHKVFIVRGGRSSSRERIRRLAVRADVAVEEVDGAWMSRRFRDREDQGVAAQVDPYPYVSVDELLDGAGSPPLLLALDQVQDPRNLGAAVRSAAAFGADGVIIHKDRSASVTAAAVKASAGMTEHVPIARATNLVRALEAARDRSIWIRGLEADAELPVHDEDLALPTLLVVGGEDSGLRRLTVERCDSMLRIPLAPPCPSLNAATAASVALSEAARQRRRGP
jgi:23S rRNA (guanosine2251-2'-O)-methyltransferase